MPRKLTYEEAKKMAVHKPHVNHEQLLQIIETLFNKIEELEAKDNEKDNVIDNMPVSLIPYASRD